MRFKFPAMQIIKSSPFHIYLKRFSPVADLSKLFSKPLTPCRSICCFVDVYSYFRHIRNDGQISLEPKATNNMDSKNSLWNLNQQGKEIE